MPTPHAVLFDIDGTLVDSNYLHIDAWQRAFAEHGFAVDAWRIHRAIGMDSAALLSDLLGDAARSDAAEAAKERHGELYLAAADRLRPLPGAVDLLASLMRRGIGVVLATSAPEKELAVLLDVLGLRDGEVATTNADDVDEAKPHPGIVDVALSRIDADAADAVFIGDSEWDMIAAGRAGVRALGVRSGGVGADELRAAGASDVVDDVHDLLTRGDDWP